MTREDKLRVWEDFTRELFPEADVAKAALWIEHQKHAEWLMGSKTCLCVQVSPITQRTFHGLDCVMMQAFEAFDMAEGHWECARAWDCAARYPTPSLSREPAARFQQVADLLGAGVIDAAQAQSLLSVS